MDTGKLFLGLDPGTSGGIAVVNCDLSFYDATKMPETRKEIIEFLQEYRDRLLCAVVEQVWTVQKMSRSSAFTFGGNYEGPIMALMALNIPVKEVPPKQWQKQQGISFPKPMSKHRRKGEAPFTPAEEEHNAKVRTEEKARNKRSLKETAQMLFPKLRVTLSTADALLIANHARQTWLTNP